MDPVWKLGLFLALLIVLPLLAVAGLLAIFIRERRAKPASSRPLFRYKRTLLVLCGILVLGLTGYVVGPMVDPTWDVDFYLVSPIALPLFVVGGVFSALLAVFIRERRAKSSSPQLLFRYKHTLLALGGILVLGIAGYAVLTIKTDRNSRADLAGDLKIKSLPASVHKLTCAVEPVWTDTLWHCYFEIDPSDFPALLAGRKYEVSVEKITSYNVQRRFVYDPDSCCALGPDFTIAKQYFVEPSDFRNGGAIRIYTDTTQHQVLYDLYIE